MLNAKMSLRVGNNLHHYSNPITLCNTITLCSKHLDSLFFLFTILSYFIIIPTQLHYNIIITQYL